MGDNIHKVSLGDLLQSKNMSVYSFRTKKNKMFTQSLFVKACEATSTIVQFHVEIPNLILYQGVFCIQIRWYDLLNSLL